MNDKLPNEFLEIVSQNNGLSRYLKSLLEGRPATPRSWLYEQIAPDSVLANWKQKLSTLENGSNFEKEVFHFDISQEEKWGPQGVVAPISELQDIVEEGFSLGQSSVPRIFKTQLWDKAKNIAISNLYAANIRNLRPASYANVVDDMRVRDVLESNSGWPMFVRRSLPDVKQQAITAAENGEWKQYPAIALFRNYNQKTRLVWMYPMAVNLVEGAYTQPLLGLLTERVETSLPFFAPWKGFDKVREVISNSYNAGMYLSASDFSATDAHFTINSTREVYDVIAHVFQARYRFGLRESLEYMHKIPLITGPTSIIRGLHGVSSGSNWTNLIETLFDYILSIYVELLLGVKGLYAIGDDMSWVSNQYRADFAELLEDIGKGVGQIIKPEKTTNEQNRVKSLQRLFQRGYNRSDGLTRGVYSTIRALKSSVYPERFHKPQLWSSDMFCARQYMILENCVDHPLFQEFVSFVVNGHRELIPFAKKSSYDLDRILRESKLLPGLNPTYNQERRDRSLASFESIRIASQM